jgi:succinate dehydrogenase / fumarate reductase flavoprotein subunit
LAYNYLEVDGTKAPIPIQPTAHYSMGGIPANIKTEVVKDAHGSIVAGLYTAGEASCLSLHGANRLGTNSLQGAATFGRIAGLNMAEFIKTNKYAAMVENPLAKVQQKIDSLMNNKGKEKHAVIREELQENMTKHVGVFRSEKEMLKLKENIKELQARFKQVAIDDNGHAFNLDLLEAVEVENLLSFSEIMVEGALARQESRGAHYRTDFPKRDDKKWLKHTLAWKTDKGVKLDHSKEVVIYMDRYPPLERKY